MTWTADIITQNDSTSVEKTVNQHTINLLEGPCKLTSNLYCIIIKTIYFNIFLLNYSFQKIILN